MAGTPDRRSSKSPRRVGLPVGVAKVVIADLIDQGALTTGAQPPRASDASFSSLLEKVLDGLDRL